ncbi:MAG: hypothetical protein IPP68_12290 [Elusimicrobia bacterium]|nr:hypothetical protein [Elusimicrobiota bacterium]
MSVSLEGEFVVVYNKTYPLTVPMVIASAFILPKGSHEIRVEFVNAATRAIARVITASGASTSSWRVVPIVGEFKVDLPAAGIYFVNAYVGDQLVCSRFLNAETDKPRYSYSLLPEDAQRVAKGEFLMLPRRSRGLGNPQ